MFDFRKVFVRGNFMAKMKYINTIRQLRMLHVAVPGLLALFMQSNCKGIYADFDILGDGCELAFCGLSMRGLLFSVPRSQEREFDCFWMHQIGLRSKQKERKQNTDKSSKFQRREQT